MAHPTDYPSQRDISRLHLSNRPKIQIYHGSHADTLVYNFLRENPNWAIDSLVTYLLKQYSGFGVTKQIIAKHIRLYILEK
jgi:lysozyme family protein